MLEVIKSLIDQLSIESGQSRETVALELMKTKYARHMANLSDADISYLLDLSFNEISKTHMQAMRKLGHPSCRTILEMKTPKDLNERLGNRSYTPEVLS
jgi:hypothetical protein